MRVLAVLLLWAAGSVWAAPLELLANRSGMFYVDGFVGNAPLRYLIDTGAEGVTIPRTAANRAGEWGECTWRRHITANGPIDLCARRVASIRIGAYTFTNVEVTITTDESTPVGLIGMSLLKAFKIEIEKGRMRLSL